MDDRFLDSDNVWKQTLERMRNYDCCLVGRLLKCLIRFAEISLC